MATLRPSLLELGDLGGLVGRQHLGDDLVDAELGGDALGGGAAVAGEHDRPHAQLARARATASAAVSRGASATAMTAAAWPSIATCTLGAALAGELVGARGEAVAARCPRAPAGGRCRRRAGGRRPWRAAPWPGTASNASARGSASPRVRSGLDDRLGERVLAVALGGGDEAQQLVLVDAVGGRDGDDLGLAAGERAGLVEHDGVERGGLLERRSRA